MRSHPRYLRPEEQAERKQHILKVEKFQKLAKKREERAKIKDGAFIEEYKKLCSKHKRLIGGLSPEDNITHLKSSKDIKKALSWVKFRTYNRHQDHFPDVGSGWTLCGWRGGE